jgi:hypothetical protein
MCTSHVIDSLDTATAPFALIKYAPGAGGNDTRRRYVTGRGRARDRHVMFRAVPTDAPARIVYDTARARPRPRAPGRFSAPPSCRPWRGGFAQRWWKRYDVTLLFASSTAAGARRGANRGEETAAGGKTLTGLTSDRFRERFPRVRAAHGLHLPCAHRTSLRIAYTTSVAHARSDRRGAPT